MKREIIEQFRSALEFCGYNYDDVMNVHCRKRTYTDLRAIVFYICNLEKGLVASQIGQVFDWNRSTVFCAIEKVPSLRRADRAFSSMYDAVHGAYMALGAKKGSDEAETV